MPRLKRESEQAIEAVETTALNAASIIAHAAYIADHCRDRDDLARLLEIVRLAQRIQRQAITDKRHIQEGERAWTR